MGIFIWRKCDGKHNKDDILNDIIENYEITEKELVNNDLEKFLTNLESAGLINWEG